MVTEIKDHAKNFPNAPRTWENKNTCSQIVKHVVKCYAPGTDPVP